MCIDREEKRKEKKHSLRVEGLRFPLGELVCNEKKAGRVTINHGKEKTDLELLAYMHWYTYRIDPTTSNNAGPHNTTWKEREWSW